MNPHPTATHEQWLAARLDVLRAEKELTHHSDELARQRQALPWVPVEKEYRFHTEAGLPAERGALDFIPPPATIGALRSALRGVSTRLGGLRPNTTRATTWRDRTHDILHSALAAPPPPPP